MQRKLLHTIGGVRVYQDSPTGVIYFKSNMTLDDDGDPFCYSPGSRGRDYLANAGHPGNWWGIVTDARGKPVLQKIGDPAPGYYVSTTSLTNPNREITDPLRYANAWTLPYVALPAQLFHDHIRLGDLGTAMYKDRHSHFIVADTAGRGRIGEGSPALAEALGLPKDPKGKGGLDDPFIGYTLYLASGTGMLLTNSELQTRANQVIEALGIKPSQFFVTPMQKLGRKMKLIKKVKIS